MPLRGLPVPHSAPCGRSLGSRGRVGQVATDVPDHEGAALFVVAVVEEAVDAGRAAGSGTGSQADVRAQPELLALPVDVVVAAARAAPFGRVGDPVQAEL